MREDTALPTQAHADVLTLAWQFASSRRVLAGILSALAALVLLSALIPQMPGEIAADQAAAVRWLATRAQQANVVDRIVGALGLFNIYGSLIWWVLCGLLFVSLTVRLADDLRSSWRLWSTGLHGDAPGTPVTETVNTPLPEVAQTLQDELIANFSMVQASDRDGSLILSAQRSRTGIWARPIVLLGGALWLIGLWISGQMAWRESALSLSPGRSVRLAHRPSIMIQLARAEPPQIELSHPGGNVRLNIGTPWPGYWGGITFHTTGRMPAVTVEATTDTGQRLALQPLMESSLEPQLTLDFPHVQTESGFAVPDRGVVFRLVSFEHLPENLASGPALLVQAFEAGQSEPVYSQFITADTTVEIEGVHYLLRLTQSLMLTAAHDPGSLWVLAGATLVWIGCLIGLLKPYQGWQVSLSPARGGTQVRWDSVILGARPDLPVVRPGTSYEFPATSSLVLAWIAAVIPALATAALVASLGWGQWTLGRYWLEHPGQKALLALALGALAWQTSTRPEGHR
jgi:hypothetical protein